MARTSIYLSYTQTRTCTHQVPLATRLLTLVQTQGADTCPSPLSPPPPPLSSSSPWLLHIFSSSPSSSFLWLSPLPPLATMTSTLSGKTYFTNSSSVCWNCIDVYLCVCSRERGGAVMCWVYLIMLGLGMVSVYLCNCHGNWGFLFSLDWGWTLPLSHMDIQRQWESSRNTRLFIHLQ